MKQDGRDCRRARAELAKIFSGIIAARRAAGSTENDMLQVTPNFTAFYV